jgi:hypothetical protein
MHINEQPQSFEYVCPILNLPRELEPIIFRAMAKSKAQRYQSMHELRKDLLRLSRNIFGDQLSQMPSYRSVYADDVFATADSALTKPYYPFNDPEQDGLNAQKPLEDTTEIMDS